MTDPEDVPQPIITENGIGYQVSQQESVRLCEVFLTELHSALREAANEKDIPLPKKIVICMEIGAFGWEFDEGSEVLSGEDCCKFINFAAGITEAFFYAASEDDLPGPALLVFLFKNEDVNHVFVVQNPGAPDIDEDELMYTVRRMIEEYTLFEHGLENQTPQLN